MIFRLVSSSGGRRDLHPLFGSNISQTLLGRRTLVVLLGDTPRNLGATIKEKRSRAGNSS